MAELATIARPYAEALFKAVGAGDAAQTADQIQALGQVAADPQVQAFASNPKAQAEQVLALITQVAGGSLSGSATNLLAAVVENGRLAVLPEIASQYRALVNQQRGVSDAVVHSAFPVQGQELTDLVATLEKRFERKLNVSVIVDETLIGGIRAVVGDEVLDTSVKARLEQMKAALTA
jgi:F-type H+-transporting ATPase subunit delta